MDNEQLKALFDKQAPHYDTQWVRMAAMNIALYFLLESVFAELPADARILCVGVATGTELITLAQKHPNWHFTALEPSGAMLDVCRRRVEEAGLTALCTFHEGYLSTLPELEKHDAATCFLVSQFILDRSERAMFFAEIASHLKPDGILASSDLSSSNSAASYEALLEVWQYVMSNANSNTNVTPDMLKRMRDAYAKDVAVLPAAEVAAIIQAGGFEAPVPFFQAGLIHAWFAKRAK
jgi:tRNA (cmo5U34)-methyltransferase